MQIIILLGVLSLPIAILLDSKRRLGRQRWGWALFSGFILMSGMGREISSDMQSLTSPGSLSMTDLLGFLTGMWIGLFLLYRGLTRKKVPDKPKQGTQ